MSGVLDHLRAVRCQGYSTICCSATRRGIGCFSLNRAGEGRAGGGSGCVTSCKGLASCSRMERGRAGRIPENQVHLVQVHLGQVEESRRAVNKCSGLRASGSAEQGGIICVQSSTTPHLPLPLTPTPTPTPTLRTSSSTILHFRHDQPASQHLRHESNDALQHTGPVMAMAMAMAERRDHSLLTAD